MNLVLSSTLLFLVGVLLGPGLEILDRPTVRALAPLTALLLGWVGAAFGIRFDRRLVARLHAPIIRAALVQTVAVAVAVSGTAWFLTRTVPALAAAFSPRIATVLLLGATAAVAGPGLMARLVGGSNARWSFVSTAVLEAYLVSALGVLAVALVWAMRGGNAALWLLLTLGSGLLIGLLFLSVTRVRNSRDDLAVALCGCLLLGAGMGIAGGYAPFLICAIGGAVIGYLSPNRETVRDLLDAWEPPAASGLLLLAGVLVTIPTLWLVPALLALVLVRGAVRWGAGRVVGGAGLAGVPQGSVALALGVSLAPLAGSAVSTVIAAGVVATQLVAPALVDRALRAAPLTPAPPAAEVTS